MKNKRKPKCPAERRAERDNNGTRVDMTNRVLPGVRIAQQARGHARGKAWA